MRKSEEDVEKSAVQITRNKQKIKYDTRDLAVKFLVREYEEGNYYIPYEYQRNFIWGEKENCFFIESILMGLPIQLMFFADIDDGRLEIVDGAQRTQTLVEFVENDFRLNDLKVLTESNGFRLEDFDEAIQRRFLNANMRVVILEQGTTEKVRQEIFNRINTGGKRATPTEVRRGILSGEFKNFLEECVKNDLFNKLVPRTKLTEDRYEGFELVSRFFAYVDGYKEAYSEYTGSVTSYIDDYANKKNAEFKTNPEKKEELKSRFDNMLEASEKVLGERGFRKSIQSKSTPRARFEALSVGIILAIEENPKLELREVAWLDDEEFKNITSADAANNKSRLIKRIDYVKNKILTGE
jgi:hypothetical protein